MVSETFSNKFSMMIINILFILNENLSKIRFRNLDVKVIRLKLNFKNYPILNHRRQSYQSETEFFI